MIIPRSSEGDLISWFVWNHEWLIFVLFINIDNIGINLLSLSPFFYLRLKLIWVKIGFNDLSNNVWNVNSNGNFDNNNYNNDNENGVRPDSIDTPMYNTYLDYIIKTMETWYYPREDEKYIVDGKMA